MSGTGYIGKTNNRPIEVMRAVAQEEREAQFGPMPGEVVDYDAATQTMTVKPLYRPKHAGVAIDMPNLEKVPVKFPRSGNSAITHPIPAGTRVMLEPSMRSLENYHTDDDGEASDARSYNLSDMEANLTGGDSLSKPLANVDPDNTHIRFNEEGTFGIRGSPDGKVKIEGSQGDIYALVQEAADLAAEGFTLLGTEPTLVHMGQYATIGAQLQVIADKLAAMQL